MMSIKHGGKWAICLLLIALIVLPLALGQAEKVQSGYLTYEEPAAQEDSSIGATIAYVFSLLFVFLFVLGLAYLVSRFIGQKANFMQTAGSSKVLDRLLLGTNQAVYVVELAGKVMILGVTGQQITLLEEVTDVQEIQRLRDNVENRQILPGNMQHMFKDQIISLEALSQKIPAFLKKDHRNGKR